MRKWIISMILLLSACNFSGEKSSTQQNPQPPAEKVKITQAAPEKMEENTTKNVAIEQKETENTTKNVAVEQKETENSQQLSKKQEDTAKDSVPVASKEDTTKTSLAVAGQSERKTEEAPDQTKQPSVPKPQVPKPKIEMTIKGPGLIFLNKPAEYTISLAEMENRETKNVSLVAYLPMYLDYISSYPRGLFRPGSKGQRERVPQIIWDMDISAGSHKDFKITMRANTTGRCTVLTQLLLQRESEHRYLLGEAAYETTIMGIPAMHISSYDTEDPVKIGKETIYIVECRNEGTSACTNTRLTYDIEDNFQFISASGPTPYKVENDNKIVFEPIPILGAGEKAIYKIVCKAVRPGTAKNAATLSYDQFTKPIVDQEGTSIYSDGTEPATSEETFQMSKGEKETAPSDKSDRDGWIGKSTSQYPESTVVSLPRTSKVWRNQNGRSNAVQVRVGEKEQLQSKGLRVMTKIDGLRACTVVDHVFYNPYDRQLEGEFKYRVPEHGSISYFAFYLDVKDLSLAQNCVPFLPEPQAQAIFELPVAQMIRNEDSVFLHPKMAYYQMGKGMMRRPSSLSDDTRQPQDHSAYVVSGTQATVAYEQTIQKRVDPALLEWAGGNVFSARIFPIRPRSFQRVIVAYEQTLPRQEGKCGYSFCFPKEADIPVDFMMVCDSSCTKDGVCNLGQPAENTDRWTMYRLKGTSDKLPAKEVDYEFSTSDCECIMGRSEENGPVYVYGRLSPQLETGTGYEGSQRAVFLMDTSISQEPDGFDSSLKLLRKILELNQEIRNFNILYFDVATRWHGSSGWMENTKETREKLGEELNAVLLEGATDIGAVFEKLLATSWFNVPGQSVDVFLLSDGQHTWGNPDLNELVDDFASRVQCKPRFYCYDFGTGDSNRALGESLERFHGGTFSCHRNAEFEKVALAHKQSVFFVEKIETPDLQDVLIAENLRIYPGQQVIFAGKCTGMSPKVLLHGNYRGVPKTVSFALSAKENSLLAPRAFATLAVEKMENGDENLEKQITAFCRHFAIPGKFCSLLMLESEADYRRFNIDIQNDIPEIHNCQVSDILRKTEKEGNGKPVKKDFKTIVEEMLKTFVEATPAIQYQRAQNAIAFLSKADLLVPYTPIECQLWSKSQVPESYLSARKSEENKSKTYMEEADRRERQGMKDASVRCMSSLIELNPMDSDTLRLAAYSLQQKDVHQHAIPLLRRVLSKRPFEPQTYRDLAESYAAIGKHRTASMLYEVTLASIWKDSQIQRAGRDNNMITVVKEDYLRMLRQIVQEKQDDKESDFYPEYRFYKRREQELPQSTENKEKADIVVLLKWNTKETDVDLVVEEPGGIKCWYQNSLTALGGELFADVTRGYGPERYCLPKALPGKYVIKAQYYASNQNRMGNVTFATVTIIQNVAGKEAKRQAFSLLLSSDKEEKLVAEITRPIPR